MTNDNSNRWDVFGIREYMVNGQQKSAFTKIGSAFTNQNGSINVLLDAIPLTGKMQLQVPLSREEREAMFNKGGQGQGQGQQQRGGGGGGGGGQQRQQQQGNPRNSGGQQRQQVANRYGGRGASQPKQGDFASPSRQYQPDPQDFGPGPDPGYEQGAPSEQEEGWMIGDVWITDRTKLPPDHPDHNPF